MTQANHKEIMQNLWSEMGKSPFVMLGIPAQAAHSEPMTAQFDDDNPSSLWFYTSKDNRIVSGMAGNTVAMAQYASKGHDLFACISGTLSVEMDRSKIDKFWSNAVEAWYDGGKADPSLLMIRMDLRSAEVWKSDMSIAGKIKLMFGGDIDREDMAGKHLEAAL